MNTCNQSICTVLVCAISLSVSAPAQAQIKQRLQDAGQSMVRGVSRVGSAIVDGVVYSRNWVDWQIELSRNNFPAWGRRRIAALFRRFVMPNEQVLPIMERWVNLELLSPQEREIWNTYKQRVYSSRGAITAIVTVIISILGAPFAINSVKKWREEQNKNRELRNIMSEEYEKETPFAVFKVNDTVKYNDRVKYGEDEWIVIQYFDGLVTIKNKNDAEKPRIRKVSARALQKIGTN